MALSVLLSAMEQCPDEALQGAFGGTDVELFQEALGKVLARPVSVQKDRRGWVMQCEEDEMASLRKIFVVALVTDTVNGEGSAHGAESSGNGSALSAGKLGEESGPRCANAEEHVQFSVHFNKQQRFRTRADVQRLWSQHV